MKRKTQPHVWVVERSWGSDWQAFVMQNSERKARLTLRTCRLYRPGRRVRIRKYQRVEELPR